MRRWSRRHRTQPVDLGEDPPLVVGQQASEQFTRREVSLRWLAGTVVTGVTSMALMGGALVVALDGRYVVNARAAVEAGDAAVATTAGGTARKGDRIRVAEEPVSTRRIIEVSTVTRMDDRDLIKTKPYALVTVSLIQDRDQVDPEIPAFDPRKLFEETGEATTLVATDAIYGKQVDGEISVSVRDFPLAGAPIDPRARLSDDEVEVAVREEQWFAGIENLRRPDFARVGFDIRAADADGSETGTAAAETVRIVPENVSELVKTEDAREDVDTSNELVEIVQPNDTLSKILLGSGVRAADMRGIDRVLRAEWGFDTLQPGQILRILFDWKGEGDERLRRPVRIDVYSKSEHLASVALSDERGFVRAEAPSGEVPQPDPGTRVRSAGGPRPTIYRSLRQTARDNGVPEPVVDVVVNTFGFDFDFNGRVRTGDRLQVLYAVDAETADEDTPPEILFASLRAGGLDRQFYRFKSADGTIGYYDESGRSPRKFLLRKPMARGVFRSGYGMRRHPILGYRKMHTGVDWAAPRGTPIYAAGDGVVLQAGWKSGYGRWTMIEHANGYRTAYAHQSRIAPGVTKGARVNQGQVIGYVGTTGLSTGPHLHYEVYVNGRTVNPLKIRLPRGRELAGDALARFEEERRRIDELIGREGDAVVASNR